MSMPPAAAIAGARPMPGWLKGGLLAAIVVGACWGGAVWYWRANDIVPAPAEMALLLLAAPVAVLLGLALGRKLIAPRAASPAAAAAQAGPAHTASAAHPWRPLAIVAVSVRSPHGASVEELSAAIAGNKARADLDPQLVDDDGFPVMTARSSDAHEPALQEELSEWLAKNGMPELHFSDEQWRALTMASGVAADLASRAAGDLLPAEGAPPMLQLVPVLPPEWKMEQRRAAGLWLKHTVTQSGWPPAHISVIADERSTSPPAVLAQLGRDAAAGNTYLPAIVVACASHISQGYVAEWAANESLFTSARPQGLIPGEGAAGLLITSLHDGIAPDNAALMMIDPAEEQRADASTDENRRADSRPIGELAERALRFGVLDASSVGMVVADTDHRARPVRELMGFVSGAMPQLDGTDDVVNVGIATGNCGAVPFITALALAHHHTLERHSPVLCISSADAAHRCAVLIRPPAAVS